MRYFIAHILCLVFPSSSGFHSLSVGSTRIISSSSVLAADFDFSSKIGWDEYYQRENDDDDEIPTTEWHSSVALDTIAHLVPSEANECLIVGCGTSHLPLVFQKKRPTTGLTLLDSSPTCMEALRERYGDTVEYICVDATKMAAAVEKRYDVVVDKGLMDAIFCGDGWNTPIELLLEQASCLLNQGGIYILIGYFLPKSTLEFLKQTGVKYGLNWDFNVEGSNDRVGICIATKS